MKYWIVDTRCIKNLLAWHLLLLFRAEGNMRESARRAAASGQLHHPGTQSLGRAAGRRYIRQGDANASPPEEVKSRDTVIL